MKKLIFTIAALFAITFSYAQSTVRVSGYTKSNGTYVESHYRTSSNSTINDNWSTKPNINPYTGNVGTKSPSYNTKSTPSYNTYSTPSYNTNYPSSYTKY